MTGERVITAAPFAWQHKAVLRKIRTAFDAEKHVASALAVYHALTEIASDEQSETFDTTHAWISHLSGFSPRTVQDRVDELNQIGVVSVTTPRLKAPSNYKLLAVKQPLPNVQQRTKKTPLPSSEHNKKNLLKTCSTKANKISAKQKEIADRLEAALGDEWVNDAGKWVNRVKAAGDTCERVVSEVENAIKERRIRATPARYAEQIWKEFR